MSEDWRERALAAEQTLSALKGEVGTVLEPWARLCVAVHKREARDGLAGLEAEKQIHRLVTDDYRSLSTLYNRLTSETVRASLDQQHQARAHSELEPDGRPEEVRREPAVSGGRGQGLGGRDAPLPSGLERGERDVRPGHGAQDAVADDDPGAAVAGRPNRSVLSSEVLSSSPSEASAGNPVADEPNYKALYLSLKGEVLEKVGPFAQNWLAGESVYNLNLNQWFALSSLHDKLKESEG